MPCVKGKAEREREMLLPHLGGGLFGGGLLGVGLLGVGLLGVGLLGVEGVLEPLPPPPSPPKPPAAGKMDRFESLYRPCHASNIALKCDACPCVDERC